MRILALDVGTKTIGVAVSDELGIAAHGVTTIKRVGVKHDIEALRKIINQYNPSKILVGVPYNIDGTVGKRGQDILKFAERIKKAFSLPVEFSDESFSTVDAEKMLIEADIGRKKRKRVIDKMAAVFILEWYLEEKRSRGNS
jgi:putative Holliday junction resolvase